MTKPKTPAKEPAKLLELEADERTAAMLALWRDAKTREADAKAEADELREQILHQTWREDTPDALKAAQLGGILLSAGGLPLCRVTFTEPVRFNRAGFAKDHPELERQYLTRAKPEVRVELPK